MLTQVQIEQRARMPQASPEHIAHALWPSRGKYRNLHKAEFKDELSLLAAVRQDLSSRNFHDLESARDFYKDLNHSN